MIATYIGPTQILRINSGSVEQSLKFRHLGSGIIRNEEAKGEITRQTSQVWYALVNLYRTVVPDGDQNSDEATGVPFQI